MAVGAELDEAAISQLPQVIPSEQAVGVALAARRRDGTVRSQPGDGEDRWP